MAFCAKCGSAVTEGASFCSACGSPVTANAPNSTGETAGGAISSNMAAALSYLGSFVTGIIFLVIEPYKHDAFVRFHAFQSICYSAVMIAFGSIWQFVPYIRFFSGFGRLIRLALFVYWIFLMYKAYNKEKYMIPVIGDFAARQAGREA
jgi:uncharacterized membrane protein